MNKSPLTRFKYAAMALTIAASLAVNAQPFDDEPNSTVPELLTHMSHRSLRPGVELYEGKLLGGGQEFWSITIRGRKVRVQADPADHLVGGTTLDQNEAGKLIHRLKKAGFAPRLVAGAADSGDRRVLVGNFKTIKAAEAKLAELEKSNFEGLVEPTGTNGDHNAITAEIKVAIIKRGTLKASYGRNAGEAETVSSMAAAKKGTILAVNGGFFVPLHGVEAADLPGSAAGITAYEGQLQSAATNGRVAAILRGNGHIEFKHLGTDLHVSSSDGSSEIVDGINRKPGRIQNCGGVGGDNIEKPQHDFCLYRSR
ncbi:hypothetical protein ABT272_42350 [Streptomyces sp900105245]|uniref:SPOR domain-containing protein n=1 Tax=Streptomyces sp. 900105245 TaxID=3154379 RepID=A0ABV1UKK1_9ACTN